MRLNTRRPVQCEQAKRDTDLVILVTLSADLVKVGTFWEMNATMPAHEVLAKLDARLEHAVGNKVVQKASVVATNHHVDAPAKLFKLALFSKLIYEAIICSLGVCPLSRLIVEPEVQFREPTGRRRCVSSAQRGTERLNGRALASRSLLHRVLTSVAPSFETRRFHG